MVPATMVVTAMLQPGFAAMGQVSNCHALGRYAASASDALAALESAVACNVIFQNQVPDQFDACIDAIFGIGLTRAPDERCAQWITRINRSRVPVLSIDVPSGLNADTGHATSLHVNASVTLSLLTLKPGLYIERSRCLW